MISGLDAGGVAGAGGHIAFNGKFFYVSNRDDNSIGIFSVDDTGKATSVGWQKMGAEFVREFTFDPSGKFLLAANQMMSTITVFTVGSDGKLTPVGTPTKVKSQPTAVSF